MNGRQAPPSRPYAVGGGGAPDFDALDFDLSNSRHNIPVATHFGRQITGDAFVVSFFPLEMIHFFLYQQKRILLRRIAIRVRGKWYYHFLGTLKYLMLSFLIILRIFSAP
jgi:hypothetical protein